MTAFRLAIFDFDGTLADSLPWLTEVYDGVAVRHGLRRIDLKEAETLRDMTTRQILKTLHIPFWKLPAVSRDMRALKLGAAATMPLFSGVREMLALLAGSGVALGIVSSDSEESVRRTLGPETSRLVAHFNCSASLFGKAKKIAAVAKTTRTPGVHTIYVGDETRDAVAARKAGVRFGAVSWGYSAPATLLACTPDHLFSDIKDLGRIIIGPPSERP